MTKTDKKSPGMQARGISDDTWTFAEYGDRLFSIGGNLFGPKSAMFKLAVAAACLDVIAQDVSKTPLELRRYTENGSELVSPKEHPSAKFLKTGPNTFLGAKEFLRIMAYQLSVSSEYLIIGRRARSGELLEYSGIPKTNISEITVNTTARKWYYDINASTSHDKALFGWAEGKNVHSDVGHIKRRTMNGLDVMSTASLSSGALKLMSEMSDFQSGTYSNGGVPTVAFTFPDGLTDKQFERLQVGIDKSLKKARKDGTPMILEGADGVVPKIERLSESTGDKEFIKSQLSAGMDIIRYFRVPPHKVYLMESIKYDNMDSAERVYVDDTLCSYFSDIQEGMDKALLTEKERMEYFHAFDIEQAYALDPKEKNEIIRQRWISGMITEDEMRQKIGLNTYGGARGKNRTFSGNLIVVDEDNNVLIRSGGNKPGEDDKSDKKSDKKGGLDNVVPLTA